MNDDAVLLRRYVAEKSEDAFAELVRRHLGFVYAAAVRRLNGDSHGAADVTQSVFIKLARDASKLSQHSALAGWLYTTTRNAAVDRVRVEQRRKAREQEVAAMQKSVPSSEPEKEWERVRPLLDATMDELDERDRSVILLRFFAGHRFSDIGVALRISEDAARMRADRALEKLHGLLKRRGVTSSATALGAALTTQAGASAVPIPAGLMGSVTTAALASATAVVGSLPSVAAIFVSMTKKKLAVGSAALIGVVGLTTIVYQVNRTADPKVSSPIFASAQSVVAADPRPVGIPLSRTIVRSSSPQNLDFTDPTVFREVLLSMPGEAIPELHLLGDEMWDLAATFTADEEGVLKAFQTVRNYAKVKFSQLLNEALTKYERANGRLPATLPDLIPYFSVPIGHNITDRYAILRSSGTNTLQSESIIVAEVKGVESHFDSVIRFSKNDSSVANYYGFGSEIERGINRYQSVHGSESTYDVDRLRAYMASNVPVSAIDEHLSRYHSNERGRRR